MPGICFRKATLRTPDPPWFDPLDTSRQILLTGKPEYDIITNNDTALNEVYRAAAEGSADNGQFPVNAEGS